MKTKKITALLLCFVMLFSFTQFTASADSEKENWSTYYDAYDATLGNPVMAHVFVTPG